MKLICDNGFYKFFPTYVGEILLYEQKNDCSLVRCGDYWTFPALAEVPNYSIKGSFLVGFLPALVTCEGKPEEVLAKNRLTYNVKRQTITTRARVLIDLLDYAKGAYLTFPNLPQAFALDGFRRLKGFEAFVDVKLNTYKIERLEHETIAGL